MFGWVTASTAFTATAASTAGPPALSTSPPARVAGGGAAGGHAHGRAELAAFGQDHDPVGVDAEPDVRRVGELVERGRDTALGRIVHRVDLRQLARDLRLRQHAGPGRLEEAPGPADHGRADAAGGE